MVFPSVIQDLNFNYFFMENKEKFFHPEYSLKKENIFPLDKLPESLSEKKRSLGWPMEIQGAGRVKEGTTDFEVHYPAGDIFLSFGIIVHELGHLRQEEFNSEIKNIDKNTEMERYIEITEYDAYQRGIERINKYFPEILEEMENKFQEYKKDGKLEQFSSFEDLYDFLKGTININKALLSVDKTQDSEVNDELEYKVLKEAGIDSFFRDIKKSRVNEKIDTEWADNFVMKMAERISKE